MLPLSLYWSPESDCPVEGEAVSSNNSFVKEGLMVNWADECDGLVNSLLARG